MKISCIAVDDEPLALELIKDYTGRVAFLKLDGLFESGIEVLEKIKRNDELMNIPVIILTKIDEPNIIEKCHRLGCSNYIVKPTEYVDFGDTVQKIGHFLSIIELAPIV